jgi:hypothetical protein
VLSFTFDPRPQCGGVRWPAARPSSHPAQLARVRREARAQPVVTTRWPRAWRRGGAAGGVQPGDVVWGIRWGQLTQEEGEVLGKAELVGMHRGGGATTGQRGRLGAVTRSSFLVGEGVGGDVGELLQHHTWRGGEEQRGNWVENPGRRSSPRGRGSGNGGPASSEERPRCGHGCGRVVDDEGWNSLG